MKVYIIIPRCEDESVLTDIKEAISANGDTPITPIELCPFGDGLSEEEAYDENYEQLVRCDGFYAYDGWRRDERCTKERHISDALHLVEMAYLV